MKTNFSFLMCLCRLILCLPALSVWVTHSIIQWQHDTHIQMWPNHYTSCYTGMSKLPCHWCALNHFNHRPGHKWKSMTWHRSISLWNLKVLEYKFSTEDQIIQSRKPTLNKIRRKRILPKRSYFWQFSHYNSIG